MLVRCCACGSVNHHDSVYGLASFLLQCVCRKIELSNTLSSILNSGNSIKPGSGESERKEVSTHAQKKKELLGGSFLWPFMLLANNIGDLLSIIRVPEKYAYWIALALFLFVGLVGLAIKFIGRISKTSRKKEKKSTDGEGTDDAKEGQKEEAEWKKYEFWRDVIKDCFAFLGGAMYIASDNLPLLYDLDIDDYVDTLQLVRASYLRNYLLAITLLIVGLSQAIPLVLNPLFGRDHDAKILARYKKLNSRSLGLSISTQRHAHSQGEQEGTDGGASGTEERKDRGTSDASQTEESIQGTPEPTPTQPAGELLEMLEEKVLSPTATPWQQFLESFSLFMVLAALSDQFYGAIISEITQDDANVTSGVTCPIAHATAGIIFYGVLSGFWVISVMVTVVVGAVKWRKYMKLPTSYCKSLEYVIIVLLVLATLVYLPLYMAADNIWPWVCLAFRNETVPQLQVARYILLPISFVITVWLLAVPLLFVSWPLRLLRYKKTIDGEEHWYHGYKPKYIRKALNEWEWCKRFQRNLKLWHTSPATGNGPEVRSNGTENV